MYYNCMSESSSQTFNISLPKDLVSRADRAAKREYRNRSELIREALRVYLQEMEEWDRLFAYGARQAKRTGVKGEADVTKVIRQYRRGK